MYQHDAERITRLLMENNLVMIHEETGWPVLVREGEDGTPYGEAMCPEDFAVKLMHSKEGQKVALDALKSIGIEVQLFDPTPFQKAIILMNMRTYMPKTYARYMQKQYWLYEEKKKREKGESTVSRR